MNWEYGSKNQKYQDVDQDKQSFKSHWEKQFHSLLEKKAKRVCAILWRAQSPYWHQHRPQSRFTLLTEEEAESELRPDSILTWQWRPVDEYKCVINLNYEFKWNRLLLSYRLPACMSLGILSVWKLQGRGESSSHTHMPAQSEKSNWDCATGVITCSHAELNTARWK